MVAGPQKAPWPYVCIPCPESSAHPRFVPMSPKDVFSNGDLFSLNVLYGCRPSPIDGWSEVCSCLSGSRALSSSRTTHCAPQNDTHTLHAKGHKIDYSEDTAIHVHPGSNLQAQGAFSDLLLCLGSSFFFWLDIVAAIAVIPDFIQIFDESLVIGQGSQTHKNIQALGLSLIVVVS